MSINRFPQYPSADATTKERLQFANDELDDVRTIFNTLHRSILSNDQEYYHSDVTLLILLEEQIDKVQEQIDIAKRSL